jgi:hypothetical protein
LSPWVVALFKLFKDDVNSAAILGFLSPFFFP